MQLTYVIGLLIIDQTDLMNCITRNCLRISQKSHIDWVIIANELTQTVLSQEGPPSGD
uniref:AlNc14C1G30 protein n=1 Tax=Albugo laibachii Nc14 TaxID=890382 RepID=F0VYM7_9STRA|nr:AlNc14C1G30 [Albugo laibachii Nc14]|eukprot:CCA13891.1 AlNc14C1G30 [Albugo laibachii Nc14]